jgi:hypothetical protein
MTTVAGNTRVIYAAIQSAKGDAASEPTHKFLISAGEALNPGRSIIQLPETDASAQQADSAVVGSRPVGGWSGWCRASEFAFLAHAALGANADTGAPSDYTHTATPQQQLPYLTLWDVIPDTQCTQYVDCRIGSLAIAGEALAGITYTVTIVALSALLNADEPSLPATSAADRKLAYPDVTITVGGSAPGTHDSFSLTIQRNVTVLPGDVGLASYDSVAGIFAVEGTFRRIYESSDAYNQFHGGDAAATALTTTIFSESFQLLIAASGVRSIKFNSALVEYTETTTPVNVDGTPIIMSRSFKTLKQAAIADNLTIVTKNGLATSVASPA